MQNYRWLEQLHNEYYAMLLRLARNQLYSRIGTGADAEDIVQEAFLLAAEKDISHHEAPEKWLMKTVYNLCRRCGERTVREQMKQQRVIQDRTDQSADRTAYAAIRQDSGEDMQETLIALEQTLTGDEWELMQDMYLQGMSSESAAKKRGISVNNLRVRIYRVRKKVQEVFAGL